MLSWHATIGQKYHSCCLFINAFSGIVSLIYSITVLFVLLTVHGIRSSLLQHHNSKLQFFFPLLFLGLSSRIHNHTALLEKLMHFLAPRKTTSCTISTFSPSNSRSSISSVDITLVFFRFKYSPAWTLFSFTFVTRFSSSYIGRGNSIDLSIIHRKFQSSSRVEWVCVKQDWGSLLWEHL